MRTRTIIFVLVFIIKDISGTPFFTEYNVKISTDDPIVKGGTIHFVAQVYEGNAVSKSTKLVFKWEDNAIPQHIRQTNEKNSTDTWDVTYDADHYAVGVYIVNVVVEVCYFVCIEVTSARSYFDITATLNGKMLLVQDNKTTEGDFVSNNSAITHIIDLKETDKNYIDNATTVFTYWFVDCTFYGFTTDFKLDFNYTNPDEQHIIEALIMADFTPLPPSTTIPPSTTSTTTTTTTTTTTSKPTTSKSIPKSTPVLSTVTPNSNFNGSNLAIPATHKPTEASKTVQKRSVDEQLSTDLANVLKITVPVDGTLVSYNSSFPFVCNNTQIVTDPKKSYGYFSRTVQVKAPISKVNVTGNNWIQHGDLLSLNVKCQGSRNIQYCIEYKMGTYNVTGNETCYRYTNLDACEFPIKRYLSGSKYTVLIIIKNEISKVVQPVAVTFYEVTTQPQLSVIVVPVAFSLVAVVLIVFGIAYYIQNRSRFVIEVADFNFGQQYSDLEYKTFRERLRDSIMNAFTRGPTPSSSEVPVWPPGRKYGSMT